MAAVSAVLGHIAALAVPAWFGYHSTTTAGMMAVVAGILLVAAALLAPRHGILVKLARQQMLGWRILAEDVVALLYRIEERQQPPAGSHQLLCQMLMARPATLRAAIAWLRWRGSLEPIGNDFQLTGQGRLEAQHIVRSHRLWEHYLASQAGVATERIHDEAMQLEHFTDRDLRQRLDKEMAAPRTDPHGTRIPPET